MKKSLLTFLLISSLAFLNIIHAQLPDDFPNITSHVYGKTAPGYIFLTVSRDIEGIGFYIMILENDGTPVYYKKLPHDYSYDFKVQTNGLLSYGALFHHHTFAGGGEVEHMVMDQDFVMVDSFQMVNGYNAESHGFQILPNGHVLMFSYNLDQFDLTEYGGYPNAQVASTIIQEMDSEKNLISQWRFWDYFDLSNLPKTRFNRLEFDPVHTNSIALDHDGHYLISSRQLQSSSKINRQTGEVMWNLGGQNNMFTYIGVDSIRANGWFNGHDLRRLPNGNISFFVNANKGSTETAKVAEFKLDEENLSAELVWLYEPLSPVLATARGNAQLLPNGNWMIGWGSASDNGYPVCSEISAEKDTLIDLYWDEGLSSYRAYRFELDADIPAAQVQEIEVAPGKWVFAYGDTVVTGVTVDIASLTGDGYNSMTVSKYNYAAVAPSFPGKDPLALAKRVVVEGSAITAINGTIIFDAEEFGITDPDTITIFSREIVGQGLFTPLTTTYNAVTGEISATFDKLGEFIFTFPDYPEIPFAPNPFDPVDGANVNQNYPVRLEWSPRGFISDFALQIATDEDFTNIVVNETSLTSTVYEFTDPADNTTYYWRAMTSNYGGDSDWSDTVSFHAGESMVAVTTPNGAEEWQVGLDYFILWEDNIPEDVVLELYKADAFLEVIDTVPSNVGYEWSIPAGLETGENYKIIVKSVDNEALLDMSDAVFSMIDTVTSVSETSILERSLAIYPNPTDNQVTIQYQLADYKEVSVRIYDITGRLLNTINEGSQVPGDHQIRYNLGTLEGNLLIIQLQVGDEVIHRKVSLIR
jgi:hypothetical protein